MVPAELDEVVALPGDRIADVEGKDQGIAFRFHDADVACQVFAYFVIAVNADSRPARVHAVKELFEVLLIGGWGNAVDEPEETGGGGVAHERCGPVGRLSKRR